MILDGVVQDEQWYPAPDGAVMAPAQACAVNGGGSSAAAVFLPLAMSANVQTYFAERFGQHVMATQVSPLPLAVRVRDDATPDGLCDCTVSVWDIAERAHYMTFAELNPRGGHAISTVPLPDCDWLKYAKVA
jgi:hypothetical protein